MTSTIYPTTWEDAGGAGGMTTLGDVLIVSQTPDVQEQVEGLLVELHRFMYSPTRLPAPRFLGDTPPGRMEPLVAALDRPINLDLADVPLRDVARKLNT